jgi:hypothetical protein
MWEIAAGVIIAGVVLHLLNAGLNLCREQDTTGLWAIAAAVALAALVFYKVYSH